MANYYCSSRSNYFLVKDPAKFLDWAARRGIEARQPMAGSDHFIILPNRSDDGAFPNYDHDADEEIDFAAELAAHLHDNSVAVLLETGAEKLRYLHGHAIAVDARGKTVEISLDDIYAIAAQRFPGKEITRAQS